VAESVRCTPLPTTTVGPALLAGGFNPTGTITFTLEGPSGGGVYTNVVTVNGNGTFSTVTQGNNPGGFLPTVPGLYQWVVSYSGDANNHAIASFLGEEPQVVVRAEPTIVTHREWPARRGEIADRGPDVGIVHSVGVGDLVGRKRAGQCGADAQVVVKDRGGSARDRRGDRPGFELLQPQSDARLRRRQFPPAGPVRFADRDGPEPLQ
jgi:hypothetical protein